MIWFSFSSRKWRNKWSKHRKIFNCQLYVLSFFLGFFFVYNSKWSLVFFCVDSGRIFFKFSFPIFIEGLSLSVCVCIQIYNNQKRRNKKNHMDNIKFVNMNWYDTNTIIILITTKPHHANYSYEWMNEWKKIL